MEGDELVNLAKKMYYPQILNQIQQKSLSEQI